MEEKGPKPDISVGIGYNYLYSEIVVPNVFGSTYTVDLPDGSTLGFSDPDLNLNWGASVFDLKAQISKKVLILRPFAGAGLSYSTAQAGGGLKSQLLYNGSPATESDINTIEDTLNAFGYPVPDLSAEEGINVASAVNGWGLRVFGGIGFKILLLNLDLGMGYDFLGGNIQAALGARMQL